MARIPIACQLYTLRDIMKTDFLGVIGKVAKIGYTGVELAGTGGLAAADLKKELDKLGLKACGTHVGIWELENKLAETVAFYKTLGTKYIVCPWWPEERRKTGADWKQSGQTLNDIGAKLRAQGMQLLYHNHAFEFTQYDGKFGCDIFFENSTAENLKCEMDLYWIQYGGQEPAAFLKKYKGRVPLVHVKDMQGTPEKKFANVGAGIMDWKKILPAAAEAGAEWYIVEQDNCYGQDPLEAVTRSYAYLKGLGYA